MKLTNDSIWLAAEELKRKWPSFIWSAIFYLYTAWMIAFFALERQEANSNPVELVVTAATFNFLYLRFCKTLVFHYIVGILHIGKKIPSRSSLLT